MARTKNAPSHAEWAAEQRAKGVRFEGPGSTVEPIYEHPRVSLTGTPTPISPGSTTETYSSGDSTGLMIDVDTLEFHGDFAIPQSHSAPAGHATTSTQPEVAGSSQQASTDAEGRLRITCDPFKGFEPQTLAAHIISSVIDRNLRGPYRTFYKMPREDQELFWNEFNKKVVYDEPVKKVRRNFRMKIAKRFTDKMADVRRFKQKPLWMSDEIYAGLLEQWSEEKFVQSSETNRQNRASMKGGSLHTGGARSLGSYYGEMRRQLERDPVAPELYRKTHIRKDGKWVEDRHSEVYATYEKRRETELSRISQSGESATSRLDENALWTEVVGGRKRGRIFGIGKFENVATTSTRGGAASKADMARQIQEMDANMREEVEQRVSEQLAARDERLQQEIDQRVTQQVEGVVREEQLKRQKLEEEVREMREMWKQVQRSMNLPASENP